MKYFTLLTARGAEKIAAATAAKTTVDLTHIALGDGNGSVAIPDASKTALANEVYRAALNDLKVDENNANWMVAESNVPANEGNFWVREVGVFDTDGDLIAIGNYPETFKPVTADGVAKDLYMKVIFEVSSSDAVTLQVDPSVVMASQEFVNEKPTGFKNLILNGDFRIWQRGTAFNEVGNAKYLADRFRTMSWRTGTSKCNKIDTPYGNGLKITSLQAHENFGVRQNIEELPKGKYTISVYIKTNAADAFLEFYEIGQTYLQKKSLNADEKFYKVVLPFRRNTLNLNEINIYTSSPKQGDYFEIAQVQVEKGSISTPFEYRPYSLELLLCQRYFQKVKEWQEGNISCHGASNGWSNNISFSTHMRVIPSVVIEEAESYKDGSWISWTRKSAMANEKSFSADVSGGFPSQNYSGFLFRSKWTADAEIY